jgi:hypothetical protein
VGRQIRKRGLLDRRRGFDGSGPSPCADVGTTLTGAAHALRVAAGSAGQMRSVLVHQPTDELDVPHRVRIKIWCEPVCAVLIGPVCSNKPNGSD